MLYSIDRLEGDVAVLIDEQEGIRNVLRSQIPVGAKAGDMLRFEDGRYLPVDDAARARREQIMQLQRKLRGTR